MKTGTNVSFLPFEMGYISDELKVKAENELGETDEVRRESLIQMRIALKEDSKLYCCDNDLYLLSFLRARKFNVKRAFGVLQNYYHIKKTHPDVYGRHEFDSLRKCITDKIINVLPYRDADGCVIMVVQLYNWKMNEMKFSMFVHGITCALIACVEDPATQVCGIKIIVDVKGIGMHSIRHIHPKYLTLIARGLRNCLPVRFREIHIFNESAFIHYAWGIISVALSDKIRNRAIFHAGSIDSLKKYFDVEVLPKEYGGELQYDNKFWVKKIDSLSELYDERMKYGYKSRSSTREDVDA